VGHAKVAAGDNRSHFRVLGSTAGRCENYSGNEPLKVCLADRVNSGESRNGSVTIAVALFYEDTLLQGSQTGLCA